MSEQKREKTAPKAKAPSDVKKFYTAIGTGLMVFFLNTMPLFTENIFFALMLLIVIVTFNFGLSYLSALLIALFIPSFVFATYGWPASMAFMFFNFSLAFYLVLKGIYGLIKMLGTGIGEKMESAHPTPPSMHILEEAGSEIGSKAGEMVGKGGQVTMGSGRTVLKKSGGAFGSLAKKFRELMQH